VLFGKKGRRAAELGVAGLGVSVLLAACAPVHMGSAAIVGSQRITVSSLDSQVSNWRAAAKPYGSSIQLTAAQAPSALLSWMIRFRISDQTAAAQGITVTDAQASSALSSLNSVAQQNGLKDYQELLIANGVPPQLFPQVGRWDAINVALENKVSGGKQPTSQAQENTFNAKLSNIQCTAAKSLGITVSPQFGRFDFTPASFAVVPGADTLSRPVGVPSPADTEGITPAC
jgi:hypothetical protein